jgi:hypothetical protein
MTLPDRVHDHRNRCSRSTGIGVHHRLELVFTIRRNAQSAVNKPVSIDKKLVYEAYKVVRANAGAAGVDG